MTFSPNIALGSTPVNEVVVNIAEVVEQGECASSRTGGSGNEVFQRCA